MAADRSPAAGPAPAAICLMGPTGTGKSDLALQLAREFRVEIVSVDSAMVYRHMDIGTAKPSAGTRRLVPHHLVDIREPWESYSAGRFRRDALAAMAEITARGAMPLLVGGTMLYFRALFRGLSDLPDADPALRAAIDREAVERGWPALHADLAAVDPVAAARIQPGDRQRIQRALEVFRLTGRPISSLQAPSLPAPEARWLRVALVPGDRARLHAVLEQRLRTMVQDGFVDEVRGLRALSSMSAEVPAMRAVGYRQIWRHVAGEVSLEQAVREAAAATRQFAKRQFTWLRTEAAELTLDPFLEDAGERMEGILASAGVSRRGR